MSLSTRSLPYLPLAFTCLVPWATAPAIADAPMAGYHLVKKIPLTGADGWDYLTVDSANHRLYISRSTHVAVIDTSTGKVVGDIPDTAGVHGIALDPQDRAWLYQQWPLQ